METWDSLVQFIRLAPGFLLKYFLSTEKPRCSSAEAGLVRCVRDSNSVLDIADGCRVQNAAPHLGSK